MNSAEAGVNSEEAYYAVHWRWARRHRSVDET